MRRGIGAVRRLGVAALAGALISIGADAGAQGNAGAVTTTSPIERVLPVPQPRAEPRLLQTPEPQPSGEDSATLVTIRSIEVTGATIYRSDELAALYAGIVGAPVPQARVTQAVRDIQTRYRSDGYFLTVVHANADPVEGGYVLRINVIEGFISDIKIEGDIGPAGVLVYNFLNRLTAIRPINISDIERALLLVQGIPGISARAVLRPGTGELGAVEMVAQVGRKPFGAVANYDNRGSTFAGTSELLVSGYANSFTSLGELTELTIFDTPFNTEQVFTQLSSQAFVGSDGLSVRGYAGYGISNPGGVLIGTGFKSYLTLAGLSTSYPFIRTRPLSLTGNLAFDASRATIAEGTPLRATQSVTNLRVLRGGGTLDAQDDTLGLGPVGANSVSMTLSKGLVGLGSSKNGSPLAARTGNVIDFTKLSGELTRVQNLFEIDDFLFALKLSMAGQYTKDILPPNEEFFLGGTRYGRGFFSGEITGDRAIGETTELQINTNIDGTLSAGLQYYLFYDTARIMDLAPGDINHKLQSAGVGLRLDLTSQFTGEIELTRRFTRDPSGTNTTSERAEAIFLRLVARY
jgi:hemolysin activation/secretion protein